LSSRRRHTRSKRDWSSDVCSSDLPGTLQNLAVAIAGLEAFLGAGEQPLNQDTLQDGLAQVTSPGRLELLRTNPSLVIDAAHNPRSEERRVGQECRSRWPTEQRKER